MKQMPDAVISFHSHKTGATSVQVWYMITTLTPTEMHPP